MSTHSPLPQYEPDQVKKEYHPIRIDCRARISGDFAECLRLKPHLCQHAVSVEGCFACMHPWNQRIIERTDAVPVEDAAPGEDSAAA